MEISIITLYNIVKVDLKDFSAYMSINKTKQLTKVQDNQDLDRKAQILTLKLKECILYYQLDQILYGKILIAIQQYNDRELVIYS